MSKLLEHTKKFMEEADIEDRKKKGQYFTKEHLKNKFLWHGRVYRFNIKTKLQNQC